MCAEVALGDFGRHAGVVSRLFKPHTSVARPLRRSAATSVMAEVMRSASAELRLGGLLTVEGTAPQAATAQRAPSREINCWPERWEVDLQDDPGDDAKRRFESKYLGLVIRDDAETGACADDFFEGRIEKMAFNDGVWMALAREDGKSTDERFLVGSLPALAKNATDLQPKDIKLIIDDTMICDHSDDDDDVQPLRDDPALDDPDSDADVAGIGDGDARCGATGIIRGAAKTLGNTTEDVFERRQVDEDAGHESDKRRAESPPDGPAPRASKSRR